MLEFFEKPGVVIVLLVALIVFGSKRLPDSARALGRSMRILKAEAKGLKDDDGSTVPVAPVAAPAPIPAPAPIAAPAPVAATPAPAPVATVAAAPAATEQQAQQPQP